MGSELAAVSNVALFTSGGRRYQTRPLNISPRDGGGSKSRSRHSSRVARKQTELAENDKVAEYWWAMQNRGSVRYSARAQSSILHI